MTRLADVLGQHKQSFSMCDSVRALSLSLFGAQVFLVRVCSIIDSLPVSAADIGRDRPGVVVESDLAVLSGFSSVIMATVIT